MKLLLLVMIATLLCACAPVKPTIPKTVTVVITKYKPLPAWATSELPLPKPKNGTVGAHLQSENDRGEIIKIANCDRHLLKKLDAGETVDHKDCEVK